MFNTASNVQETYSSAAPVPSTFITGQLATASVAGG